MRSLNRIIAVMLAIIITSLFSCSFIESFSEQSEVEDIDLLTFNKTEVSIKAGQMDYLTIKVSPASVQRSCKFRWEYDHDIIECDTSSSYGVVIKGKKEGQTSLKCSYAGLDATCLITIAGIADDYQIETDPYIYSNTTILQTQPGVSERIYVSLYGGDAKDIDGYNWSVDNSSVLSIEPTGQYCLITAQENGYARIKVTHPKASYPYYIGVYSFSDNTDISYITTNTNIVTMNVDDDARTVEVSLVNEKKGSLQSGFKWEIIEGKECISIDWIGNKAVVTPVGNGVSTIRVTHPDAAYPLDIMCRVISVVKNVYIEPDETIVRLSGSEKVNVCATLKNISESEYSIDEYEFSLDNYDVADIVDSIGNTVVLKGKKNGSCKLLISHPKAAYSREVLLISSEQALDAVDTNNYITTSQNYIKTKIGEPDTVINVALKGGSSSDSNDFTWEIENNAVDGHSEVISLQTVNGSVSSARSSVATFCMASAVISPKSEGSAVIKVGHKRIAYKTEILVKVLPENALLESPMYFVGDGLVKILNGETEDFVISLKGKDVADESLIEWKCVEPSSVSVVGNGLNARLIAPSKGSGTTYSTVNISHPAVEHDKSVMVVTADTEEELSKAKAIYSDKLYYNVEVNKTVFLSAKTIGFEQDENYATVKWTTNNPSLVQLDHVEGEPLCCNVRALNSGEAKITVEYETFSCTWTITIYPEGCIIESPEVYLTTTQNVITIKNVGDTAQARVTAINLNSFKQAEIQWSSHDDTIAQVIGNGSTATIKALKEGETYIELTHPESQNVLKIYVHIGSSYIHAEENPVVYISSQDVLTLLRDEQPSKIQAVLVNSSENSGFDFSIDNESVAQITAQTSSGIAYVKPVSSGQAEITVRNSHTDVEKKILVLVGNSLEELASLTYLTTSNNVVAIGEGASKTVSVQVKNSDEIIVDGYQWTSSNPAIVDVVATGATASLKGNSIGTAIITVKNSACAYSLQIIAQCVNPIKAAENPYIQLSSSVITANVGGSYSTVTADLVGGNESDYANFVWISSDSSICTVFGQNEVAKLKALKNGQAYVTVSHPKSSYTAQLLVVCDNVVQSDCYISVPQSIINIKPTDPTQTITASLVNGDITDKYNFKWSLDVFDVVDIQYSANICTITPKQSGSATLTVSHPKSAYDQQIIINVQEYTSFGYPDTNKTMIQGSVEFLTMQVPVTKATTHVEYSSDNPLICEVHGTKSVAQITAINKGTTTVKAKLISSSSGTIQATTEMMVYVKEKPTDAVYITSGSTITTLNKGKSQTLTASLTGSGVVVTDQQELKWTTSDSDIVQVTGINSSGYVTGPQIYITAKQSGEALITCSHPKANSTLQFYVVVPGSAGKTISLNKSYISMIRGNSGVTLKATIENSESSNDYYDIIWSCEGANGKTVAKVMGSGQTVTIYPVASGEAVVYAQLPDSSQSAKCTVKVEDAKSFVFENNSKKVQPVHTARVKYTVSPVDAILTWTSSSDDDYFIYTDLGCDEEGVGYLEVEGIKEGTGNIYCVTDGGAKGSLAIKVSWDYSFTVSGSTVMRISPSETRSISYKVNPTDADIKVSSTLGDEYYEYEIESLGEGSGNIIIKPKSETPDFNLIITATNPNRSDEVIGKKIIPSVFKYDSISIVPEVVESDGNFSMVEDGILHVGDGEKAVVCFKPEETKASYQLVSVSLDDTSAAEKGIELLKLGDNKYAITGGEDLIDYQYRIITGYKPTLYGNDLDVKQFKWVTTSDDYGGEHDEYAILYPPLVAVNGKYLIELSSKNTFGGLYDNELKPESAYWYTKYSYKFKNIDSSRLAGVKEKVWVTNDTYYKKTRDSSLDGKVFSREEFESIPWYYRPPLCNTYKIWNETNLKGGSSDDYVNIKFGHGSSYSNAYVGMNRIDTDNIDAVKEPCTNKEVVDVLSYPVTVNYIHNGVGKSDTLMLLIDRRECIKELK